MPRDVFESGSLTLTIQRPLQVEAAVTSGYLDRFLRHRGQPLDGIDRSRGEFRIR
jgi:hypothetical protein